MNYAGITEVCNWLHCFTHSLERLSPFYYFKFHNIAVIALCCLLFTFDLHCSVFKVLLPVSFKTRSKYLMFRYFDPILNFGGDSRARTDDPLLAKQVLSQLSYTPIIACAL